MVLSTCNVFIASTFFNVRVCAYIASTLEFGENVLLIADTRSQIKNNSADLIEFSQRFPVFSETIYFNELCAPLSPKNDDAFLNENLISLTNLIDPENVIRVYATSVQGNPASAFLKIFQNSEFQYYFDGLMSYSPSRRSVQKSVLQRLTTVHLPDHIRDPSAFFGYEMDPTIKYFNLTDLYPKQKATTMRCERVAIVVGQNLSNDGVVEKDVEQNIWRSLIEEVSNKFPELDEIVFKAHPRMDDDTIENLKLYTERCSLIKLRFIRVDKEVELLVREYCDPIVIGVFSTSLLSLASSGYTVYQYGASSLLRKISPYENSNRIPILLSSVLIPSLTDEVNKVDLLTAYNEKVANLHLLVAASMQPRAYNARINKSRKATCDSVEEMELFLPGNASQIKSVHRLDFYEDVVVKCITQGVLSNGIKRSFLLCCSLFYRKKIDTLVHFLCRVVISFGKRMILQKNN